MPTSATASAIDELKATLSARVPLCTGIVPLDAKISQLFYRAEDGSLGFIDFSTVVSDAQLEGLAQACQPATFGRQQQDVLDESYRKAGKMDAVNFSTNFNPNNTGIMQAISDGLLLKNPQSSIQVELHKLNVYGPGSFFKAHVDTPRNGKMFGSLVVVLPTKHEGGALPLRHHGREWVFNSADIVSPQNSDSGPRAAFVAFFGDIEHEVTVVKSGYRVTLTYNLYFGDNKSTTVPSVLPIDDTELKIKRSLTTLLNDQTFLPDGGLLGFGLSHLYAISQDTDFDELGKSLKGTDAAIKRACDSLFLEVSVNAVYTSDDYETEGIACLLDDIPDLGLQQIDREEQDIAMYLKENSSGLFVFDSDTMSLRDARRKGFEDARPIVWLKPLTKMNRIESPYVSYGNEATLDYIYVEICLVLEVQSFKNRETYDF